MVRTKRALIRTLLLPTELLIVAAAIASGGKLETDHYDVIIYKATPAGIAAAVAVSETCDALLKQGNHSKATSVAIIEPTWFVGGMATQGGIGMRDGFDYTRANEISSQHRWGRMNAEYYGLPPPALVWQPDHWVGSANFRRLLSEANVDVLFNTDLLEGPPGVVLNDEAGRRIVGLRVIDQSDNRTINLTASYFIDASYEGDLMRAAGIDYTVGRESKATYDEDWGGVTNFSAGQFRTIINPFRDNTTTDESNLLRYVWSGPDPDTMIGKSDDNVMAYSYRICLTEDPKIKVDIGEPRGYNPDDFELVRRLVLSELEKIKAGQRHQLSDPFMRLDYAGYKQLIGWESPRSYMKYDACCGNGPVGIDAVGLGRGYANATRQERARMAAEIQYYVHGLMWFYLTDPVVPIDVRAEFAKYGLCGDEWVTNNHFPRQLYIREAARMIGDHVFTQNDRLENYTRNDSIAVGSWGLDVHEMQRVAALRDSTTWQVVNEGLRGEKAQGGTFPFEIPYSIILPKRLQATNLAVVCAPSSSHIGFAAIREEPTLWQFGRAAGVAATIALAQSRSENSIVALHDVSIVQLQHFLLDQGALIHVPEDGVWRR
jgi:FAD dependent oxidoreductase